MLDLYTVSFFGHRTINETKELKTQLRAIIEKLIAENSVDRIFIINLEIVKIIVIMDVVEF